MNQLTKNIAIISFLILLSQCGTNEKNNIQSIGQYIENIRKIKTVEYGKFPPRMVKVFLRLDGAENESLFSLLDSTKMFVVVHIPKESPDSTFTIVHNEVQTILDHMNYHLMDERKIEDVHFREYFKKGNTDVNELILEINESNLYTLYCLKGMFSKKEIEHVSKNVSPKEFLTLNRKIRK